MSRRFQNKTAVKFDLLPRPQTDPLLLDEDAPSLVLVPKRRVDEQRLKSLQLDESLLPSKNQGKKGILQKAYEKDGVTLDGDVLKAMSKDFDYHDPNNIIDDDFFQQAGGLIKVDSDNEDEEIEEYIDFDDAKFADNMSDFSFNEGDAEIHRLFKKPAPRSRRSKTCSNFSMTSSIMRRNQGLQQIDEHFERLYEREYADDDDDDDDDQNPNDDHKTDGVALIDKQKIKSLQKEVKSIRKKNLCEEYKPEIVSTHHKEAIVGSDSEIEEDDVNVMQEEDEEKVDCESVLSSYSNMYNHPKVLDGVKAGKKHKHKERKMDVDDESGEDQDEDMSVASSRLSVLTKISCRQPDETPSDKRSRKQAVKQYRRMRREEKKTNKNIFKSEQQKLARQQKVYTQIPLN